MTIISRHHNYPSARTQTLLYWRTIYALIGVSIWRIYLQQGKHTKIHSNEGINSS